MFKRIFFKKVRARERKRRGMGERRREEGKIRRGICVKGGLTQKNS
jgi:hypothetical protein